MASRRKSQIKKQQSTRQPRFETLEDRRVFALPAGSVLVPIDPSGWNRASWTQVDASGRNVSYFANLSQSNGDVFFSAGDDAGKSVTFNQSGNTVTANFNGRTYNFAVQANSRIYFTGGDGNDTFTNNTNLISQASGGKGRDTLIGGSNVDVLSGGAYDGSYDRLYAGYPVTAQDDKAGDILKGNGGDDLLRGGQGNDLIEGGAGNDRILGYDGDDVLKGGANDDTYAYPKLFNWNINTHGNDTIDDGEGRNGLDFMYFHKSVIVDLAQSGRNAVIVPGMSINLVNSAAMYKVVGSAHNDTLLGGPTDNHLDGDSGADILEGRGGNDYIQGGPGNDRFVFRGSRLGSDTLADWRNGVSATNPENTLDFGMLDSAIQLDLSATGKRTPSAGNLELTYEFPDLFAGVIGTPFNDTIYGNDLKNLIDGAAGNDILSGRGGDDTLRGNVGNDIYLIGSGAFGDEKLEDDGGIDAVDFRYRSTAVQFYLNKTTMQNVNLDGSGGTRVQLVGATNFEILTGSEYGDILGGNSMVNTINGRGGDDHVSGYEGNDWLYGDAGNDKLYGGAGHDLLNGGANDDTLTGDEGNDFYEFSHTAGRDEIADSSGLDALDFRPMTTGIRVALDNSNWQTFAGSAQVKFQSTAIENVYGSESADTILGNDLENTLHGQGGNDTLYGRGGADALYGDAGNDGLYGGIGNDIMLGGGGADRLLHSGTDTLFDVEAIDAVLTFAGGSKNWLQPEIEQVDAALKTLHDKTNNTRLLKTASGGQLTFVRQATGSRTGEAGNNEENGRINLMDLAFNNATISLSQSVVHEIAHNWDDEIYTAPANAQLNNEFTRISGWRGTGGSGRTQGSAGWYYTTGTKFARDYGSTDVYEDIATVWESYFYGSSADRTRLTAKFEAVDRFMATMTTRQ